MLKISEARLFETAEVVMIIYGIMHIVFLIFIIYLYSCG